MDYGECTQSSQWPRVSAIPQPPRYTHTARGVHADNTAALQDSEQQLVYCVGSVAPRLEYISALNHNGYSSVILLRATASDIIRRPRG